MSKARFTKGPWEAKTDKFGGMQMGLVYIPGGGFDVSGAPDSVANANLIACAPEMYEMLIRFLPRCDYDVNGDEAYVDGVDYGDFEYNDPNDPIIGDIRALLVKARGEHDTNS